MSKNNIKFYIYKKWRLAPQLLHKPYKAIGRTLFSSKSGRKTINMIDGITGEILIVCKHDGFEDSTIGEKTICINFITNCWRDYRKT